MLHSAKTGCVRSALLNTNAFEPRWLQSGFRAVAYWVRVPMACLWPSVAAMEVAHTAGVEDVALARFDQSRAAPGHTVVLRARRESGGGGMRGPGC